MSIEARFTPGSPQFNSFMSVLTLNILLETFGGCRNRTGASGSPADLGNRPINIAFFSRWSVCVANAANDYRGFGYAAAHEYIKDNFNEEAKQEVSWP